MMTNDKDSAVLADKSDEYAIGHLSALLEVELHENGHTIGEDLAEKLAEIAVKTVRQPTQSDALRDLVAALYCASGCSCCRDDDAWEKASDELGQLFNIPKYKNGYGYDWHSVHEAALQEQSK